MNFEQRLEMHAESVGQLRAEIDAALEDIGTYTENAREKLLIYSDMKQQTESLLDGVGEDYRQAERLIRQAGFFSSRIARLEKETRKLDRASLSESISEPEQLKELKAELRGIRQQLTKLKRNRGWCREREVAVSR